MLMDTENDPFDDPLPRAEFVYPGSNVVPMPDPLDRPDRQLHASRAVKETAGV